MTRALASAVLLTSALWTAPARAANVTVATPDQLTAAVAAAQAGDTITLRDGSFTLAAPLMAQAAGSAGAPIRVTAQAAHAATLVAGSGAEEALRISGPFWIFDGVDLTGGIYGVRFSGGGSDGVVMNARISGSIAAVRADCGGPEAQPHCDRGTVSGCELGGAIAPPGCAFAGVEVVGGADWRVSRTVVDAVTIDTLSCPQSTTFGIVARGNAQRATVDSVVVTGVAVGIALGPTSDPCEVRGSVNNGTACTAPTSCAAQSSTVRNSVVFGTSDDGVLLQNACTVTVHGLTLWNDGTASGGRRSIETRVAATVDVSDTILNAPLLVAVNTTQSGGGNLILPTSVEPSWFLDAAHGNFRLAAGSPAIDNGLILADLPIDFDGVARPQGAAYDVGAFERPTGGYPDGGMFMNDGGSGNNDLGSSGGGGVPGPGGGMTQPPKEGCQCSFGGGTVGGLPLLLLIVIMVLLVRRRTF